ncbi:hypothetical protein, partial [Escherichia coli]|uniref:hypothetical protein n=1 Tax=Escherichia coli TaxID=562 RepID=UPI001BAF8AE3
APPPPPHLFSSSLSFFFHHQMTHKVGSCVTEEMKDFPNKQIGLEMANRNGGPPLLTLEVTARFEGFSARITNANVNFCGSPGSAFFCHKKAQR